MTDDEAQAAGEVNMRHSHATHDLFNHIGSGKEEVWVSSCLAAYHTALSLCVLFYMHCALVFFAANMALQQMGQALALFLLCRLQVGMLNL